MQVLNILIQVLHCFTILFQSLLNMVLDNKPDLGQHVAGHTLAKTAVT